MATDAIRVIYIAKFADTSTGNKYASVPKVKAWGVFRSSEGFLPLVTQPQLSDASYETCGLFQEEECQLVDVNPDDPNVPDEFWAKLARWRLTGEKWA